MSTLPTDITVLEHDGQLVVVQGHVELDAIEPAKRINGRLVQRFRLLTEMPVQPPSDEYKIEPPAVGRWYTDNDPS